MQHLRQIFQQDTRLKVDLTRRMLVENLGKCVFIMKTHLSNFSIKSLQYIFHKGIFQIPYAIGKILKGFD